MSLELISGGINLINSVVNRIWPDATEAEKQKLTLALSELDAERETMRAQAEINLQDAKSENRFNSGWRPFVGWVCGISFAYAAFLEPLLRFISAVIFGYNGPFPQIDTTITMQVLFGLLGFAGFRSFEKISKMKVK
jgi:hypothetical protein